MTFGSPENSQPVLHWDARRCISVVESAKHGWVWVPLRTLRLPPGNAWLTDVRSTLPPQSTGFGVRLGPGAALRCPAVLPPAGLAAVTVIAVVSLPLPPRHRTLLEMSGYSLHYDGDGSLLVRGPQALRQTLCPPLSISGRPNAIGVSVTNAGNGGPWKVSACVVDAGDNGHSTSAEFPSLPPLKPPATVGGDGDGAIDIHEITVYDRGTCEAGLQMWVRGALSRWKAEARHAFSPDGTY